VIRFLPEEGTVSAETRSRCLENNTYIQLHTCI